MKAKSRMIYSFFILIIMCVSLIPSIIVNAEEDTTPPQLTIYDKDFNCPDSIVIVHGWCYDESGIQKVTVNGEDATGWFSEIQCGWQRTVYLTEGSNSITVIAYDNSPNHNEITETFTITYQSTGYNGPLVQIIPESSQPSNEATVKCTINPSGKSTYVYLWASYTTYENAPFNWGRGIGTFSGSEEIVVEYTFDPSMNLQVGQLISYIFRVRNSDGTAFTQVETFEVDEPIPTPDTEPPELVINQFSADYYTQNSEIIVNGNAWDASGIKNVTINGELATGLYYNEWMFWQKSITLVEGPNLIEVTAYDNTSAHLMSEKIFTITYQPTGYSGPTIWLIPETEITANSVTLNCIINPQGTPYTQAYLWLSDLTYENAPFQQGRSLGNSYSGNENISISYTFESSTPDRTIMYMFYASNNLGRVFTEIGIVNLQDLPIPTTENLVDAIQSLTSPKGIKQSLTVKLQNVIKYLEVEQNLKAIHKLEQFIQQVSKLPDKIISNDQKTQWTSDAQSIINMIQE